MLAPTVLDNPPASACHRADPRDSEALGRSWWLFAAHGRHVKRVAESLRFADVPHFVPIRRVERVKPNRTRYAVDEPIFGSYLFVCGDEFDRTNALAAAPGRLRLGIPIVDVPALLHDLSQLMDAIESGAPIGRAVAPRPGSTVRVTSGPWEDKVGTLVREAHGGSTLLLHVHCLGQAVELEIESWRCELVAEEPTPCRPR